MKLFSATAFRDLVGIVLQALSNLLDSARYEIGEWITVKTRFLYPQIGVFSFVVLIGTARQAPLELLLTSLIIISFLLFEYLALREGRIKPTYLFLGIHLSLVLFLLLGSNTLFNLPMVGGFFLPIILSFIALFVMRLPWQAATIYASMALSAALFYAWITYPTLTELRDELVTILWFTAQVLLSLIALSFVRGRSSTRSDQSLDTVGRKSYVSLDTVQEGTIEHFTRFLEVATGLSEIIVFSKGGALVLTAAQARPFIQSSEVREALHLLGVFSRELSSEVSLKMLPVSVRQALFDTFSKRHAYILVVQMPGSDSDEWALAPLQGDTVERSTTVQIVERYRTLALEHARALQRAEDAAEFDSEFDSAVHEVNNCAQDVILTLESSLLEIDVRSVVEEKLSAMSWLISDTRILRELLRVPQGRTEQSSVQPILEELQRCASWMSRRFEGVTISITHEAPSLLSRAKVLTLGGDFTLAVLRYLLARGARIGGPPLKVSLLCSSSTIEFRLIGGSSHLFNPRALRLAETLCSKSGGELRSSAYIGSSQFLSLIFPAVFKDIEVPGSASRDDWVLVLEDGDNAAELYSRALQTLGFTPHRVRSMGEADSLIAQLGTPYAIVSDRRVSDGVTDAYVLALKKRSPLLRILVISGDTTTHQQEVSMLPGVAVLQKPISRKLLLTTLQRVFNIRSIGAL
jgi:CheY-like chemotaxis protein